MREKVLPPMTARARKAREATLKDHNPDYLGLQPSPWNISNHVDQNKHTTRFSTQLLSNTNLYDGGTWRKQERDDMRKVHSLYSYNEGADTGLGRPLSRSVVFDRAEINDAHGWSASTVAPTKDREAETRALTARALRNTRRRNEELGSTKKKDVTLRPGDTLGMQVGLGGYLSPTSRQKRIAEVTRSARRAEREEIEAFEEAFGKQHAERVLRMTKELAEKRAQGLYPSRRVFRPPVRPSGNDLEALAGLDDFEPPVKKEEEGKEVEEVGGML